MPCGNMQVGLAELKPVVEQRGGMVVQIDTFHNPVSDDDVANAGGIGRDEACC
jgi:hypothetical protein